jgi:hypothetical protein
VKAPAGILHNLNGHHLSRAATDVRPPSALAAERNLDCATHPAPTLQPGSGSHHRRAAWAVLLLPLLIAASCRTYIVNVTIENHTGGAVNLLEVDYPSASFGVDTIPPGAVYHYHLQLQDSGPIKISYMEGEKQKYTSTGPAVHQNQQGQLEIVLNANGKTEFHAQLAPPN